MKTHKLKPIFIESVCIVAGETLKPHWENNMQLITTDQWEFIDAMPGEGGHPWYEHVGEDLNDLYTYESAGYHWLQKGKDAAGKSTKDAHNPTH